MGEYIKKYPWLKSCSLFGGDSWSEYDIMDDMPSGWRIAFGDLMCDELDAAIKKAGIEDDFAVYQIKEKFGCLRMYVSHSTPEIVDILDKYCIISKNVCIKCGKPDVHTIKIGSSIYPYCEECFYELPFSYNGVYDDLKYSGDGKIHNTITMKNNKLYLKDTADKIRARWSELELGRS